MHPVRLKIFPEPYRARQPLATALVLLLLSSLLLLCGAPLTRVALPGTHPMGQPALLTRGPTRLTGASETASYHRVRQPAAGAIENISTPLACAPQLQHGEQQAIFAVQDTHAKQLPPRPTEAHWVL